MTSAKVVMIQNESAIKARSASFSQAEQRAKVNQAPTLERAKLLVPTEAQMAKIVAHFNVAECDVDELVGHGDSLTRSQYESLSSILGEHALKINLGRLMDVIERSAIGAAEYYERRRAFAADANNSFSNDHRDEDRVGVDGGENRAAILRRIAAEKGAEAFAVYLIATGADAAYKELMGSAWVPYQASNKVSVSDDAARAELNALGI